MFDPDIAPSGTLLGLLQRGRGDGTLHALAAPRAEALAALHHCVLRDPRHDWQLENRSLYYARLHLALDGGLDEIEQHLFGPDDLVGAEERTGLALSVLGHLAGYGRDDAQRLLRRYAATGGNWAWALDELAVRADDATLRGLGASVLARFPYTPEGDAVLAAAVRDAYEPRPWRLWAENSAAPGIAARVRAAREQGSFDRWQRQLRPAGPSPGWSVREVLEWVQQCFDGHPAQLRHEAAARCLAAVAGPEDRPRILEAARNGPEAARSAALRFLADQQDPDALDLLDAAAASPSGTVADTALSSFERMRSIAALERARAWAHRTDAVGNAAAGMLACRGGVRDAGLVLAALRRTVRAEGSDARDLWTLVDGTGRLGVPSAAPVLRHIYRETSSSQLRGRAARALAATDPSFGAGFAVECLWDCEESTRELAARHVAIGDARVVEQLRMLAADPAEEAEVQTAVRSRIGPDAPAV